ncbi:protein inturned [Holotrichia oblita]|uniref:Protein inturned n=1 Tax=Holotrichia oblita TaxID=644536 RepID=A0ACB9STK0_HOLOL|nr:protein inturned [Holotrichia oblita]
MNEQQCLIKETPKDHQDNSEEEWSEDESSSNSEYSDSDSSVPEWESSLDTSGQVLYIDCHPFVKQSQATENDKPTNAFVKSQIRQSTRSKFLKLLRRRDSKRRSKRSRSLESSQDSNSFGKVTFQDHENGEIKEVYLVINRENSSKYGRRTTLSELLLGISLSSFPNSNRVMIAGFTTVNEQKNEKNIKIGDWLRSIDDIEVNINNINITLEQLSNKNEVKLQLQRVVGIEVTKEPPVNELKNQSNFVYQFLNYDDEEQSRIMEMISAAAVGILFLDLENLTEEGSEFEGVIYCYPRPYEKNILCQTKGIFITLSHLLCEITKSKPTLSSLTYKDILTHVIYNNYNGKLLLIMIPDHCVGANEVKLVTAELIRMLEFMYQTIEKCFGSREFTMQVDHFFARFFTKILSHGDWSSTEIKELNINLQHPYQMCFEEVLPAASFVPLPNETQMQIDDALTELEASDYRDWNEEPLDCQRLFTILGSALYHSGYLLASHLIHGDLIDVHSFCRQQGLFHLSKTEPLRSLVLWREVFPFSCNRSIENPDSSYKIPDGRRYLLIIGSGKDLLAVIMEAGGCTEPAEDKMGPDAFYVEEVQATLSHIQELGIPDLVERWLATNPGQQVTVPEAPNGKKKSDFLSFTKSTPQNQSRDSNTTSSRRTEVTSILKRRSSDQGILSHANSMFSLPDEELHSEDSNSQGGYSERSEVSDEPVLGRRAIRERKNYMGSDEEESDIEDYREGSQLSNGSYDLSDIRQSLLNEMEEVQPLCLTAGKENVLYHYVHFDSTEGILLLPPECRANSLTLNTILQNFRNCSHNIHKLFQNTLRFKNMSAQDMAKSLMNKSLIAIKEHGVLFECEYKDDCVRAKPLKITYWVIGRLFYMPYPREMYVCYQDTIPQNLIDIAFKLGITLSG